MPIMPGCGCEVALVKEIISELKARWGWDIMPHGMAVNAREQSLVKSVTVGFMFLSKRHKIVELDVRYNAVVVVKATLPFH